MATLFCFDVQSIIDIGQLAAEYGQKTIFKMVAIRHLEF